MHKSYANENETSLQKQMYKYELDGYVAVGTQTSTSQLKRRQYEKSEWKPSLAMSATFS